MDRADDPDDGSNAALGEFYLSCDVCSQPFDRAGHLERHRLTHHPISRESQFRCPRCDQGFALHSVFLHHMRSAHHLAPTKKSVGRNSCVRCRGKKIRCDRAQRCSACRRAGSACEYTQAMEEGRRDSQRSILPPVSGGEVHTFRFVPSRHCYSGWPGLGAWVEEGVWEAEGESRWMSTAERPLLPQAHGQVQGRSPQPSQSLPLASTLNIPSSALIASTSHLSDEPLTSTSGYNAMDDEDYDGLSPTRVSRQPDFNTNGFDWLDFDPPNPITRNHNRSQNIPASHRSARAEALDSHPAPQPRPRLQTAELQHPQTPAQLWPFDHTLDSTPHRYSLPPLKEVLQSTYRPGDFSAWDARLDNLVQLLSGPRLPPFGTLQGVGAAEAFGNFQRLLDLYFAHFHNVQAIIHKPTWDRASAPTVLLAAMACLGALMSDDPSDVKLSSSLSDLCMSMIMWMGTSDGKNYQDIFYLNALCLHQTYSFGSGNRQLYHSADQSRGTLIGGLRGMGLLSTSRTSTRRDGEYHPNLDSIWKEWIAREQERRAVWAAFEYDCSLRTLTSRRGAVDLGELPQQLPCLDALWEAASATAWCALRSRMRESSFSPRLSEVLKTASPMSQSRELTLGSWAKRLCAQVVGRLLWDLKQLEVVTMPEHLGLLSSLPDAHRQSKQDLLVVLRNLFEMTASPLSTAELITHNITGLLCHYSHLYAAGDVMDVAIYLVRGVISPDNQQTKDLDLARRKLRSIFAQDAQAGRTLTWHAAQILAIANEYLVSAPCEIMRVFMGYVFIMAYSAYSPRALAAERDHWAVTVRLDVPGQPPQQKQAVADWIRHGGPARVGSVGDICSDGCLAALSNDAQAMMQKLRCWGLAEKFTKIMHIIGEKGL